MGVCLGSLVIGTYLSDHHSAEQCPRIHLAFASTVPL
jgi:hypothetical protein